jgi:hypothetical protein
VSKTTKTTSQNSYAPGALSQYTQFMNSYSPMLNQWAQNPYNNLQFQNNLSQNLSASNRQGMNQIQNSMAQFNMTGFGGAPSGARTQLMNSNSRYGTMLNSNAFFGAVNTANQRQTGAVGAEMSFNPLNTGGTQTQTTGGLGSWLPQLAGAALGGLTSALTSGMSGGGGLSNLGANPTAGQSTMGISGGGAGSLGPISNPFDPSLGGGGFGSYAGPQATSGPGYGPSNALF